MEMRCIVCGSYYQVNEHEDKDLLTGPPVCSTKCMYDLKEQNQKETVINNIENTKDPNQ